MQLKCSGAKDLEELFPPVEAGSSKNLGIHFAAGSRDGQ